MQWNFCEERRGGVAASQSHHRLGTERSLRSEEKGCERETARLK